MPNSVSFYDLDCITEELLANEKTMKLVTPYIRPLQLFLQIEILPAAYRSLPLRELLSYMQLSQEMLEELEESLRTIPREQIA